MKEIGTVKIHCVSEALSIITHMMGVKGNEALINRENILHDGCIKSVPVLSGNALRHKMIREPGALHLVDALGLRGQLTIDQANFLFTGGSLSESSVTDNLKRIADMQSLFPLLRLLGGSLRNQVIGGSLFVLRGTIICEETRSIVQSSLPEGYLLPEEMLRSCEEFIRPYQYTRGSAEKRPDSAELIKEHDAPIDSNLMIYAGESVIPGAIFYHGFVCYNVSRLEIGALLHAFESWQNLGGVVGGYGRIGHGKLKTTLIIEPVIDFFGNDIDIEKSIEDYKDHVKTNASACVIWLQDALGDRKEKAKKI